MTDLLILTNEHDYSLDRVIHWINQNEPALCVKRINRERTTLLYSMSAVLGEPEWSIRCDAPRVFWLRQFLPERDPYGNSPQAADIDDILIRRRQWLAWTHLFSSLNTRWLNDPRTTFGAESKVAQLAVAGRIKFDVPRTLLTWDRDDARLFTAEIGPCVVKSVDAAFWEFSDQSFVFTAAAEEALTVSNELWHTQPVIVQERIDGTHDARLLLIGNVILGAKRPRVSLDWRTDPSVAWSPWTPDHQTTERAVAFAREFALDYGAFDFILGSESHRGPVFLECNPAGDFGFLDDVLGRRPSHTIAKLLVSLISDES